MILSFCRFTSDAVPVRHGHTSLEIDRADQGCGEALAALAVTRARSIYIARASGRDGRDAVLEAEQMSTEGALKFVADDIDVVAVVGREHIAEVNHSIVGW